MPKEAKSSAKATVTHADYQALAEFRYHIRRYLNFSEQAAKAAGIEPKQYQLLLAIKGLPENVEPTVGTLAEQLRIRHHSTVELINRTETNNFVQRTRAGNYVFVRLTKEGHRVLARGVERRLQELNVAAPLLVHALRQLTDNHLKSKRKRKAGH